MRRAGGLLVLLLAGVLSHAQGSEPSNLLEQARSLRAEGKTAEAGALYRQWLQSSAGPEYAAVLREAVDSQRSARAVLGLLGDFTPGVLEPGRRAEFQSERVDLLRLLGRYDEALGAARQMPGSPRRLYLEALLFYEQGLFDESVEAARRALDGSPEAPLAARLQHVLARSLLAAGRPPEAEAVLLSALAEHGGTAEAPALLLARVELLVAAGRLGEGAAVAGELAERFPDSPESVLAERAVGAGGVKRAGSLPSVAYAPTPLRLLPEPTPGTGTRPPQTAAPTEARAAGAAGPPVEGAAPQTAVVAPPSASPVLVPAHTATPPATLAETPPATPPAASAEAAGGVAAAASPAVAPAAVPAAVSAAETGPKVLLQTGSFRDPENAEYMARDLKARGFSAEVVPARVGDSLYHRVLVGPPQSVADAQGLLVRLKEAGFEGMLYFP